MKDPDRGPAPHDEGMRAESSHKAKGSRRARRKRKASRDAAKLAEAPDRAGGAQARPPLAAAPPPANKKKRRRRSKGGVARIPAMAPQPAIAAVDSAGAIADVSARQRQGRRRPEAKAPVEPLAAGGSPHPQPVERRQPGRGDERPASATQRLDGRRDEFNDDLYAALDLGTNNCRLLIAQPTRPGQFRVVDAFSRIVRLGEGLAANGRLSQEAMDRAVDALRICAGKLKGREIRRMRLIATEACRAAENGEAFLRRVRAETGLELEIINRETEARLAVSGCASLVGREARSVVLFDIGGGSSEIAVIRVGDSRSSRLANHITHWTSLPVGVVTLSERHGGRDVTPEIFEAMTREVEDMLRRFDCPPLPGGANGMRDDFHLIGTSGTVTTLAGVHLDLPRYDRRRVDGVWLTDTEVSAMQARLLSWDYVSRAANPCIGPDRADLVLAGCAILEAIRRRWPARRMRVADRGLREGLLTDMMADDGVWRRNRSPRRERG